MEASTPAKPAIRLAVPGQRCGCLCRVSMALQWWAFPFCLAARGRVPGLGVEGGGHQNKFLMGEGL